MTTSEPYVMGSHATCSGAWASGPEDCAPADYQWGYNRMTTVEGLFGAGDTIGGSAHKFSSGSFTGELAGKSAVKYIADFKEAAPEIDEAQVKTLAQQIFKPLENYKVGRNEIVAGTVSPSYLLPFMACKGWTLEQIAPQRGHVADLRRADQGGRLVEHGYASRMP